MSRRTATAAGDVTIPSVDVESIPEESTETESASETATETDGNTDTESTVIGTTKEQTISVSLPISWTEDGCVDVIFTFEFNNQIIPVHYPQESWHSGRHTILLYYPIENVVANYTNTFNVYMRCLSGSAFVDTGFCIASISGQSMGASAAWDGKIEIEEYTQRFGIGGISTGILHMKALDESVDTRLIEIMHKDYTDSLNGKVTLGAFAMPFVIDTGNSGSVK